MQSPEQPTGLTAAAAAARLAQDGPNALPAPQQRTWLRILRDTLREPMFLLLFGAGALYLALGDLQEGIALFGFVLATVGLTLYQEGRTEKAMQALRDLASPRALVLRDGKAVRIAGREVVVGDVLLLAEGDRVPADAVLLSANELQADESLLTGESLPVDKLAGDVATAQAVPGAEGQSSVYAGTLLVRGQGVAQVTATGVRSAMGRIGSALETIGESRSPLQQQTTGLVRRLALLAVLLSAALVVLYVALRGEWVEALLAGIALAMAMLPEEYAVVLTVFPALGAWRLSRQRVLTRRIAAIETLGATSVLCTDKTGTLTENRMTVAQLHNGTGMHRVDYHDNAASLPEPFHALVEYAILASENNAIDPMEQAFHRLGKHFLAETEHLHSNWQLVHEYGLSPVLRAMAHVWQAVDSEDYVVAAKGAPEAIIDLCHLESAEAGRIAAAVNGMAADGLRVLAVAQARFRGDAWPQQQHDFDFRFVGLLGLDDPLRSEIPAAVAECRSAGIRVLMITGDYPATARTIAQRAGLPAGDVLTGDQLATLDDKQLQQRLRTVQVCARIAPEQKLRIVQALKADGEIVAMTGDGVNDAPALKAAHVGVAMGQRGSDVAREASSLVLLDDNFASIVRAVTLGRRIFDNLQKSMSYTLSVHVPIAGMALLPVLFGLPGFLLPMHIAFLELVLDPACSLAFENEPAEDDLMQRPPRAIDAPLFGGETLRAALLQGAVVLLAVLAAYAWGVHNMPAEVARAFGFALLVLSNVLLIFSHSAQRKSLLASLASVTPMVAAVASGTCALLLLALYLPLPARLLGFAFLPPPLLLAAAVIALLAVAASGLVRRLR